MAIEVQEIEGHEIQIMLASGDRFAQLAEVRQAGIVENNDLAVDDGAFHLKLAGRLGEATVFRRPV